jgi:hypothetical protein
MRFFLPQSAPPPSALPAPRPTLARLGIAIAPFHLLQCCEINHGKGHIMATGAAKPSHQHNCKIDEVDGIAEFRNGIARRRVSRNRPTVARSCTGA